MDLRGIFAYLASKRLAVVSSVDTFGGPESALISYAVAADGSIVFDTLSQSRKAINFRANQRAALVVGWDENITLQVEGLAIEPSGETARLAREAYFEVWPEGRQRALVNDTTYFVVKPIWLRYSCYVDAPNVAEFSLEENYTGQPED